MSIASSTLQQLDLIKHLVKALPQDNTTYYVHVSLPTLSDDKLKEWTEPDITKLFKDVNLSSKFSENKNFHDN